jgi:hypothetical protein
VADTLLHFSEDPSIRVFDPHVARTAQVPGARVWAIDAIHAPSYWFPRDCPRACCWAEGEPVGAAVDALLGLGGVRRMHAIESGWLERMRACRLYVYRFAIESFVPEPRSGGAWCARERVEPLSVEPVGDLLERHAEAGIELRIVPNLWPLIDAIVASGLAFSIIRKANARPRLA